MGESGHILVSTVVRGCFQTASLEACPHQRFCALEMWCNADKASCDGRDDDVAEILALIFLLSFCL